MERYVEIWKAARLAGVSRSEIQVRIARGDLESFEGRVDVTEVQRLYPGVMNQHGAMIEFVEQVKEDALHKGIRSREQRHDPPGPEDGLARAMREIAHFKRHGDRQRTLLDDVERMLVDLEVRVQPAHPVREVLLWLRARRGEDGQEGEGGPS